MSSIANETQVGGDHYRSKAYQHWDFMADTFGAVWFKGCATKYVARHRQKNGLQDLQKARHYLVKLIELIQQDRVRLPLPWGFADEFVEANNMGQEDAAVFSSVAAASNGAELAHALGLLDTLIAEVYGV